MKKIQEEIEKEVDLTEQEEIKEELLENLVEDLLGNLSVRTRKVLNLRFGLDAKGKHSLNAIGKKMGITRERVRQIEIEGLKKIKKISKSDQYQKIIAKALLRLDFYGGFCEKRKLKEDIKKNLSDEERSYLMIIFNASNEMFFQKATMRAGAFWYDNKNILPKKVFEVEKIVFDFIERSGEPVLFENILKFALEFDQDFFDGETGKRRLRMILLLSRDAKVNILEQWGSRKWDRISGRSSRERAYLVFRKHQEPMHFRQLAVEINKHFKKRETLAQTVHNELIKDTRFVQVGKGIYGLAEWGLARGTVKDLIVKILKEKQKMPKEEIMNFILLHKRVKKTTIEVNLSNQNLFSRDREGHYFLVK